MYGAGSRSDQERQAAALALAPMRVVGGIEGRFAATGGVTRLMDAAERGGYRLMLPTTHAPHAEAVQINTGGGVAGGDRLAFSFRVDDGGDAVVATQAAERIYRAMGDASRIDISLAIGQDARLDWLPQDTILFAGARLERRYTVDLTASSRLLLVEATTFGRIASGERMASGALRDRWRVRRDGKLVFADDQRLEGDIAAQLDRPAIAGGGRAIATLLLIAPDAEEHTDRARTALVQAATHCGISAWNGMLTARFVGSSARAVRQDVVAVSRALARRDMPRVWQS